MYGCNYPNNKFSIRPFDLCGQTVCEEVSVDVLAKYLSNECYLYPPLHGV
jgi:hypothetical protein